MSGPYIVSDCDGKVSDDATTSTNQTPVSDRHDNVRNALLTWDHSRRQRHVWTNQGVVANGDIALIENSCGFPHDHASLAKGREFLAPNVCRASGCPKS